MTKNIYLIICCFLSLCAGVGCVVVPKDALAEFPTALAKILNESPRSDEIGSIMSRDFVKMGGKEVGRIGGWMFAYEFKNCVVIGSLDNIAGVFSKKEIELAIQAYKNVRHHLHELTKSSPWYAQKIMEAEYNWKKEVITNCPPRPDYNYFFDLICQTEPPGTYLRSESLLLVVSGNELLSISAQVKSKLSVPPEVKREDLLRCGKYALWNYESIQYPEAALPSQR